MQLNAAYYSPVDHWDVEQLGAPSQPTHLPPALTQGDLCGDTFHIPLNLLGSLSVFVKCPASRFDLWNVLYETDWFGWLVSQTEWIKRGRAEERGWRVFIQSVVPTKDPDQVLTVRLNRGQKQNSCSLSPTTGSDSAPLSPALLHITEEPGAQTAALKCNPSWNWSSCLCRSSEEILQICST